MDTQPVIVVGAGPTGLTLACDLLHRGIAVQIIDKAAAPATTSRALGLHARAREVLERLQAMGDLPQKAAPAIGTNIYLEKRRLAQVVFRSAEQESTAAPLIVGQAAIEAALRDRLAQLGGAVQWGHQLTGIDQTLSAVEITVRTPDGEDTLHGSWLIGCDGAHSQVRKASGIAFDGVPMPEWLVLADVEVEWDLTGYDRTLQEGAMWLHPEGFFGAIPLPNNVWRVFGEISPGDPLAAAGRGAMTALYDAGVTHDPAVLKRLQQLMDERSGTRKTVLRNPTWISVFRFHRRLAGKYRQGRILLAGDAAHIYNALGGQGMNTGVMDAANLGWKLALVAKGQSPATLLDTYEAERRPVAASVVKNTARAWHVLVGNTLMARFIRNALFLPLLSTSIVQGQLLYLMSQLRTHYRGGPLARRTWRERLTSPWQRGPQAGHRGPDARCVRLPDGATVTLKDVVRTRWALVLFGDGEQSPVACVQSARTYLGADLCVVHVVTNLNATDAMLSHADTVLHDTHGLMDAQWHPAPQSAALVRPDGIVAWRGHWPQHAAMTTWLGHIIDAEAVAQAATAALPEAPETLPRRFKAAQQAQHTESARR